MPTLAEQRAAIRAGVNSTRAGTGAAERRAIGQRIVAERRGESVVEDINRLITPTRVRRTLRSVPAVGALPSTRGRGNYTPPPATGGGIASPLTEKTKVVGDRVVPDDELWSEGYLTTDALLVLPAWKTKRFTDANGAEQVFEYANPNGVEVAP